MSIPGSVMTTVRELIPQLEPQPVTAQLDVVYEFAEAEEKFNIQVIGTYFEQGMRKLQLKFDGVGPYYEPIWANNGRPYIRHYNMATHEMFDVFILPPDTAH